MRRIPYALSSACFGVVLLFTLPDLGAAQPERGTSVGITVGGGSSWGGDRDYTDRANATLALTLTARHKSHRLTSFAVALMQTFGGIEACDTEQQCDLRFPGIISIAALPGLEFGRERLGGRAMLGPAVFLSSESGVGTQGVLDGFAGGSRLGVTGALRGSLVVRLSGETLWLGSAEVGVRIH